ncbi:hypothetical protein, conserved [Leishmania donovani]|uniref:Uncharacterized protein n=1 Tax=Leishmania donovani TaxID=5661 RepID=E9BAD1_LEIDO|nr:hypothetical protein, conserved [Leishmania donovani]CBZ32204.1 hypothetical protein, conserved [Leishmania donovani]
MRPVLALLSHPPTLHPRYWQMLRRRIATSFFVGVAGAHPCKNGNSHSNSARCLSCSTSLRAGGVLAARAPLLYVYKPPGSSEPSRLPWYQHVSSAPSGSTETSATTAAAASAIGSSSVTAMRSASQSPASPLHSQNISAILQAADAAATAAAASVSQRASTSPVLTSSKSGVGNVPSPAAATPSAATTGSSATAPAFLSSSIAAATQGAFGAAAAAAAAAASASAALHRQDGALRPTPTRRMAAVSGPTLDARVEDIVKVEETLASELTLPKVVQLLIDPQAEGVERITMSEFVAMQPKRQLLALGGRKEWQQWMEQSTYYQQAARLAAESPAQDLAALQQAGIQSLQQWLEHPQLVKVSARTRSALDTAVAQSVEAYMAEVVKVVNTSNQVEDILSHWVSDVMGKFVLDSLQIPIDRASQAMWAKRKEWMPADVVHNRGGVPPPMASASSVSSPSSAAVFGNDVTGRSPLQSVESRMLGEMLSGCGGGVAAPVSVANASQRQQQQSTLRPGEACTLDHYLRFVQKVISSVRQDYVANHAAMGAAPGGRGDDQAEREITERSYGVIAAAFTQLLEQAVVHQLPPELQALQQNGYLALDRVPGLLKRAGSLLELRSVPVRYFVFHSSVDEAAAVAATTSHGRSSPADASLSGGAVSGLAVQAPPHYASGTFLTGSNRLDVTLGEWSGQPDPPSSTARESGGIVDDATEQEYLSMLHRLRRRVETLAVTSLYEVIAQPERFGGNGFSAAEAIGLDQLFGPVKLLEDRLTTLLHYPPAAADKPIHFIEAGPLSGKTALLEQLAERTTRPGDKVVLVRYGGSATPYLPDLDDHPVAFAARFWFRVALASCPYLIRTEELYSRAPRSVYWWGHENNWSWERYQSLLQSARNAGTGHRQYQQQQQCGASSATVAAPAQLASILVDDVDRALSAMQVKWGNAATLSSVMTTSAAGGSGGMRGGALGHLAHSSSAAAASRKACSGAGVDEDAADGTGEDDADDGDDAEAPARATAAAAHSPSLEQQRQQVMSLWLSTGKSVEEHLYSCFTQISAAVGQVNFVFAGTAATPLLLAYCPAPCRRYYLPLSGGVGLQSRLRVLPLLSTLHALHLTHRLDMPGLLYEVLKNAPALAGKALELFWSHRVSLMDLRTGLPRLTMGNGSAHPQLLHSYVPRELFAELPVYITLLQDPRRTRRRLVELLQRQLSSPTGYLSTELDTTPQDVKDGLVLPHNHTSSQVHPFALFAIFSRQDAIDERVYNSEGQLLEGSELQRDGDAEDEDGVKDGGDGGGANARPKAAEASAAAARLRSSTGVGSNERKVVRAWAEVWAEYRSVVSALSTTPARKRDAMRILLHGALLLRSAAVAGAQLELNLKVPSFGFPLLASETRVRGSSVHHLRGTAAAAGESLIRSATPETVRRAVSAYKMFFSNAAPSHFPFRPMVGLNGGCDVVFVCGSTLALYNIVATTAQLRHMVARFAEALLGVLHVLMRQVLPADKVRAVQYVSVVSLDEAQPGVEASLIGNGSGGGHANVYARRRGSVVGGGVSVDVFNPVAAPTVPYCLDYDAVFEDHVIDRLRELQQSLGITKDFRTLSELIDEIEHTHRVRVLQNVVSTPEEVESLFSPTLLQLVPDSTVLPAYTSAVVSATDLMVQAMSRGAGGRKASGVAADVDDDDDADYVNIGEEDIVPGAELDDLASEARLLRDAVAGKSTAGGISPSEDLNAADGDYVHESAALLEAMMNDELDSMTNWTAQLHRQREETARDLQRDLVMEDRINYNAPPPSIGASAAGAAVTGVAPSKPSRAPGQTTAEDAEVDALAWLHDVITPESLIAGLKGSNPGAQASAPSSSSSATAAPGAAASPQGPASPMAGIPPAAAGGGLASHASFAGSIASVTGPWTPNPIPPPVAAPDGAGGRWSSVAAGTPTATTQEGERGAGAAPAGGTAATGESGDGEDDSGEEDEDEEELDVVKPRGAEGSRRKGGSKEGSKMATVASRRPRRESHSSSGKRSSAASRQKRSASTSRSGDRATARSAPQSTSQTKRRKSSTFAAASASSKKGKAAPSYSSSSRKKSSSSRRR